MGEGDTLRKHTLQFISIFIRIYNGGSYLCHLFIVLPLSNYLAAVCVFS